MLNEDTLPFSNSKLMHSITKIIQIQIKIEVNNSDTKF